MCACILLGRLTKSCGSFLVSIQTGLCRRNLRRRKSTMEAISENFIKVVPKKAVKFKVQSVVTIRNKNNEDTKKKIVIHLVAFTNKIRRNVALELISTEIDSVIDMKKLVEIRDGHDDAA
ncbi:linoleate 13S-lipoxygenase 3-1, chloroplastic-like [Capsicum annuum]